MLFAGLDTVLTGCETFDLLIGPPGGVGFAAAGAGFDFGRALGFVGGGLGGAADLAGVDGDLEAETAFGVGNVAAVAFDDAGAGARAWGDGFAIGPVAFFDDDFGAGAGAGAGAAAIAFLGTAAPVSFFTTLPPPRIG